ncbi:MAG: methyltransferase type 11 [Candidatus Schekmanbacteria bacterium RBG_16_38_10]|uniref:Methyltransferase type 11 n=1 Tax=Candidatus Schekmanbacteria bacterium RBG_16_38_10 TaxID=1817879 RepID=A0A1F7S0T8_9BACT|nr:MAG: methyltransferase type 11 [Candidatus Schekmanbacteria bacterium RBG_16_38_10]
MTKDSVEIQREHFNHISKRYIESRSGKNHLAYKEVLWRFILGKLAEYLPHKSHIMGLEVMCGNAEASKRIVNFFPTVTMHASDLSDSMVVVAEKIGEDRITISQGDILKLDQKETYDLIVVIGGLHHIPSNVQKGLHNIHNALKKGGIFLNLEPTHNNLLFRSVRERIYRTNSLFEENSERAFNLKEYHQYLADNKLRIIYQFYPGLLGYILYYNPDAFPGLNIGTPGIAKLMARMDIFLGRSFIGKFFSFATWVIAEKQ